VDLRTVNLSDAVSLGERLIDVYPRSRGFAFDAKNPAKKKPPPGQGLNVAATLRYIGGNKIASPPDGATHEEQERYQAKVEKATERLERWCEQAVPPMKLIEFDPVSGSVVTHTDSF